MFIMDVRHCILLFSTSIPAGNSCWTFETLRIYVCEDPLSSPPITAHDYGFVVWEKRGGGGGVLGEVVRDKDMAGN